MENEKSLFLKDNVIKLVNMLEDINTNIDEFEILDTSVEDWSEILSKSSKIIGVVGKTYNISQEIFFKRFLKGLATQINTESRITNESKQKLNDYLSKTKNIEFVYTTIRKALTANTLNCTELLSIIVGEILVKRLEMTQENITIIDALHSLNDYDLKNFYKIYNIIFETGDKKIRMDKLFNSINKDIAQISINKLVNLQLFLQDTITIHQGLRFGSDDKDPLNTIMEDSEKFLSLYSTSDSLYNLLNLTKDQILLLN